jgi:hypothetical protein
MKYAKFLALPLLALSLTACEGNKDRPGIYPAGVAAAALLTPIILIEGSTGPKPVVEPPSKAFDRILNRHSRFANLPLNSGYEEAVPLRWLDSDRLLYEVKRNATAPSACTRDARNAAARQCTLARWAYTNNSWELDIEPSPDEVAAPLSNRYENNGNNPPSGAASFLHDKVEHAVMQSLGRTPVGDTVFAKVKNPLGSTGYFVRSGSTWLRVFDAPPAIAVEYADLSPDMCKMLVRYRGSSQSYNFAVDICGAVKEAPR